MQVNYRKLKGRIVEKCGTQTVFARKLGRSERTVSHKLSGLVPWTQPEIVKTAEILELPAEDIQAYFFTVEVQEL